MLPKLLKVLPFWAIFGFKRKRLVTIVAKNKSGLRESYDRARNMAHPVYYKYIIEYILGLVGEREWGGRGCLKEQCIQIQDQILQTR